MKIFSLIYLLIFFMVIPFIVITDTELLIPFIFFTVTVYSIILVIFKLINTKKKTELTMINNKGFWKKVLDEYLSVGNINLHQGSKTFNNIWSVSCEPEDNDIKLILRYRDELRRLANLYLDQIDAKRERWLVLPSETVIFSIHPNQSLAINVRDNNIEFIEWNIERLTNNTALTH